MLARLFDARRQTVQLKLPNGKLARLVVYQMAPEKIRSLRFTPDRLRQPFVASLLVPQPGVFRFRASADSSLRIGLQRLRVKHAGNERSVCLATGLHRIEYSPARPGEIIEWLPPGASGWEPLPATLCWRLPPGSLPPAQPTRTLRVTFRQTKMLPVPVAPPYHYNRVLQDLAKSSGGYYILDLDRYLLKRWRGGPQIHMDPILRQADGHPFQYRQRYEADRPKEFSLSVAEGIYLLQRREKTIHRFDRNGSRLGTLAGPFVTPVDLAATKAAILVADPGQQALLSCDPAGKREARTLVRDIRPVAVAALEGRIAYLDQRRHQLVVCGPNGATRRTIQLGRVARRMRLSLASNGQMVLCDPDKNRVLLFGANGDLLAPGSDPLALTPWLTRVEEQPAAAHFDSRTKQLTILGLHGKLLQFDQLVPPDHRAGLTLRSVDAQSNLNKTAHADFGAGLVIDGGLHPAFCRWRFTIEPEGTYEVWAYYAVDDERPLTLTVDGKVRAQGLIQLTGGYTVRDLRWHLLGKVRLDRGHHTLELTTESLFPHLARVRLVRQ